MDSRTIQSIVEEVLQQINKKNVDLMPNQVPISVSARHVHLSVHDLGVLFGVSYSLTKMKDLYQPNQFAAEETVTIAGPKGSIERVRILGPSRSITQVEVSQTDAIKLGLNAPLRQSGNISGSAPVTIIGPNGSLYIKEGLIIAQRHIHMAPSDAERFGVKDGQFVQVKIDSDRPMIFEKVLIRVSSSYLLEMHIDTDEANASFIKTGQAGQIVQQDSIHPQPLIFDRKPIPERFENNIFERKVLSQSDIQKNADTVIRIRKSTIVTDLAKETALEMGKRIEIISS
jgi:putative phosphotransacetylase